MLHRCGQTKAKHTQSTLGSPGRFGTAEGRETMRTTQETSLEVNADPHRARIARMNRVGKAEFSLLDPKCLVGAAKLRQITHNPHMALQGPFDTAEGHETTTTSSETPLEVNADPHCAHIACAKLSFHSLTRNAPSVRSNLGKTHAIHTWFSSAHLAQPRAAKPRKRHWRRR